jgi:hypothetical protein
MVAPFPGLTQPPPAERVHQEAPLDGIWGNEKSYVTEAVIHPGVRPDDGVVNFQEHIMDCFRKKEIPMRIIGPCMMMSYSTSDQTHREEWWVY